MPMLPGIGEASMQATPPTHPIKSASHVTGVRQGGAKQASQTSSPLSPMTPAITIASSVGDRTPVAEPESESSTPSSFDSPEMHTLQEITWLDGDIKTLPSTIYQRLEAFCSVNETQQLPCARRLWANKQCGTSTSSADGWQKVWISRSQYDGLSIGRFKYGKDRQFLVAQAASGRGWEHGAVAIIVHHKGNLWKTWRHQMDCRDIPEKDVNVACYTRPPSLSSIKHSSSSLSLDPTAIASSKPAVVQDHGLKDDRHLRPCHDIAIAKRVSEIVHQEGDIRSFPNELMQLMQQVSTSFPTTRPPCVTPIRSGQASLYELPSGARRDWVSAPYQEPLKAGHFAYKGWRLFVVQGFNGSTWESGAPRIIFHHPRSANYLYRIWRGQRVAEDTPVEDDLVKWVKIEESDDSDFEDDILETDQPFQVQLRCRDDEGNTNERHDDIHPALGHADASLGSARLTQPTMPNLRASSPPSLTARPSDAPLAAEASKRPHVEIWPNSSDEMLHIQPAKKARTAIEASDSLVITWTTTWSKKIQSGAASGTRWSDLLTHQGLYINISKILIALELQVPSRPFM